MKVGGVPLDSYFVHRVLIGIILSFVFISLLVSVSAAILLVTSFCFGATLLSAALDFSHGYQFPNLLVHWKKPLLHPGFKCSQCGKQNCLLHLEHEPATHLNVPREVDEALHNFLEKVLEHYVYFWYREISYDEDFVQELRLVLRHAIAILGRRLCKVDLTDLIVKRVIPIALCHVDAMIQADTFVKSSKNTRQINLDLRQAYLDYLGPRVHPAAMSRVKEHDYVQGIVSSLVPFLLPPRYQSSKTMIDLINDILFGAVLQPVLDLVGNPDMTANVLIALAFHPSPSRKFPPGCGQEVEILESFVNDHRLTQTSALHIDMSTILKNESSLFAFMNFLKEKQALDQLHFCLAVEEFNKKIMNPELGEDTMKSLHEDALSLYNLHFKSDAEHKVPVSDNLVQEIKEILDGPMSNVVQLRSTPPLFKAYEEVYSSLESKYCPAFFKSEEYFTYLLGKRVLEGPDQPDKNSSRTKDLNAKAGDKINKGLNKLKHGVLGKSMEGIIDAPTDPAFDMAEICKNEEDEEDPEDLEDQELVDGCNSDETLRTSASLSLGNRLLEYRDLSAWRVQIPEVKTTGNAGNGTGKKVFFTFTIEVQRIDITSRQENAEDLQWTVQRKYSEFYTLESKLTEFHGTFEDLHLPAKASLFTGKGLDVMHANRLPFQDYLTGLLKKPFLRESDILFTFLTSPEEFTLASSTFGVGRIINKVNPMKLTMAKERGQNLQPFIDSFVASTLSPAPKPRYDSVIGGQDEHDEYSARVIEPHPLFGNNFDLLEFPKFGLVYQSVEKAGIHVRNDQSTFEVLFYLAVKLFKVSKIYLQLLHGFGVLLRKTFDHWVDCGIGSKLSTVLCCNRVAYLINLLSSSLFDQGGDLGQKKTNAAEEKRLRKEQACEYFQAYLRPLIQPFCASSLQYEEGSQFVFDVLQDPVLNKQLTYVLIDVILDELFPEIIVKPNKT